jgi:hypothetical protein
MARPAPGQVVERRGTQGRTFAIRFRAYGKRQYVTLGQQADGWTRTKAEQELADTLALVRKNIWRPPRPSRSPPSSKTCRFDSSHSDAKTWKVGSG